ncbi:MAG: TonB-dependent receptor plug domain-containing protein [Calditrichaceae bacterium]
MKKRIKPVFRINIQLFLYITIAIFYLFSSDVRARIADPDSVQDSTLAEARGDSIQEAQKKAPGEKVPYLKSYNYDIHGKLFDSDNNSDNVVYRFENILHQNYNGLADVFRTVNGFRIFDFFEMGRPRYVSASNLLPHQTGFRVDGLQMNDPINGMYNTRFLPLDIVQSIETDQNASVIHGGTPVLADGVNATTQTIHKEEPYTRMMYREGDYGYTDLDITFAQKINNKVAVQLGGINKDYSGWVGNTDYSGTNYRGTITYQITPELFSRFRFNLNSEKTGMLNFSSFPNYRYLEYRKDYYNDITWLVNKEKGERWHFQTAWSENLRKTRSLSDSLHTRMRYEQIQINADRNWHINGSELYTAFSFYQNQIWGNTFNRKYIDSGLNGMFRLEKSLSPRLVMTPSLETAYLYDNDLLLMPCVELKWGHDALQAGFSASRRSRYPHRNERSYQFETYRGNDKLKSEKLSSLAASMRYQPREDFFMKAEIGFRNIDDEIIFTGSNFRNGGSRSFTWVNGNAEYSFYQFKVGAGGELIAGDLYLTSEQSFWMQAGYQDKWLKDAVTIDAAGSVHWYGNHDRIEYDPWVERFFAISGNEESYLVFSYKVAATVKDVQFFLEMDNPFGKDYSFISGYYEQIRRVRAGLNWVLWD